MLPVAASRLAHYLSDYFHHKVEIVDYVPFSGGCIHNGGKLRTSVGDLFLKWNEPAALPMFEAEMQGLQTLRSSKSQLRVPEPYFATLIEHTAVLALEFLPHESPTISFWEALGTGLAELHHHTATQFGFASNNFIGSLPQSNRWHSRFVSFFIEERLIPQIERAVQQQRLATADVQQFEQLFAKLTELLPEEAPALLHGDLWSGNCFATVHQQAAIVDPAVYYGHREAELAFTLLFGGFHQRFYQSYTAHFPLLPDWQQRAELYNLYPLLVHLNLFGTAYLSDIRRILRRYAHA